MARVAGIFNTLELDRVVMTSRVGDWCRLPYPGHKRGCPKYGMPSCPPGVKGLDRLMDFAQPIYLVYSYFDLAGHAEWMKMKHPRWTDRQCRCLLYWQGIVRADLRRSVSAAKSFLGCDCATYCPEGMGVNVFVTARLAGLKLDKTRRLGMDHHIALVGHSRGLTGDE